MTEKPMATWMIYGPEQWKHLLFTGLTHYSISNYGRVYNTKTENILTPQKTPNGYLIVTLYYFPTSIFQRPNKQMLVHRLVALYFLALPKPGQTMVNHKDLDKTNNHVSNLEWVSAKENYQHAVRHGHAGNRIPRQVNAVPVDGGDEISFNSLVDAAQYCNGNHRQISDAISTGRSFKGYWFYDPTTPDARSKFRNHLPGGLPRKPVKLVHEHTGETVLCESIQEAARYLKVHPYKVHRALSKPRIIHGYFIKSDVSE